MNILENELNKRYYALIYTYKTIGLENLSSHYLRESEIKALASHFDGEMILLQTCNRIELYLYTKSENNISYFLEYLDKIHGKNISSDALLLTGKEVAKHLFEVAAGIDSLSIGEYEILSQIKLAVSNSNRLGISGKCLNTLFERAIKIGRRVRTSTNISRGKVGIYSLAIELVKSKFGNLDGKKIAIIGAGDIGKKLAFMLYKENVTNVTILNRTPEKAKEIAEKYGFKYASLDFNLIDNYDIVFVAIFYPGKINVQGENVIIDLSSPTVFQGKNVITMEELQGLSKEYLAQRMKEISYAKQIISDGIEEFLRDYENIRYNEIVSNIMSRIEEIRETEISKAIRKISDNNAQEILDAMTKSMIKKIFAPLLDKIRIALENGDTNYINYILELFNNGKLPDIKTEEIKE